MAQKEKTPRTRAHKVSGGGGRGCKPTRLTEVQKVLIGGGGLGHSVLRGGKTRFTRPKYRGGKKTEEL